MGTSDTDSAPAHCQWAEFDQLAISAVEDPQTVLHELRSTCPVGHSDKHGGFWAALGHHEVAEAARDVDLFRSADPGPGFPIFPGAMPLIGSDAPLHREYRTQLQKRFSPGRADAMRDRIREIVTGLIDGFIERGSADLAAELCIPLPAMVTADLLDLPVERRDELSEWTARLVAEGPESTAFQAVTNLIDELYDVKSTAPGDDIASIALDFTVDGKRIERANWVSLITVLVMAGLDTTSNGGALILHYLATNPDVRAEIIHRPEKLEAAVDELLRLISPVPQHARGVSRDAEIFGQRLKKGDVFLLHWLAANRDPVAFPEPDEFKIDRSPNRHYAFGFGVHRCLGANVAKVELEVLVEEMLRRLPDYSVVPEELVRYPGLNRGMSGLGVRFTPASALRPTAS